MRGRKPKPTATQIAAGDPRKLGAHKLQAKLDAEPKATKGFPACPRHLRGRARAAWKFWTEELEAMGIDKRPDSMMLEGACIGYERAVLADLIVAKEGLIVKESRIDEESGEVVVLKYKNHPAIAISRAAWTQLRVFSSEFGLSPVSRTRLTVEKTDSGEEDLMAILSKPRAPRPVVLQ